MSEITTVPICKFYLTIYKRMVRWFGFTYPYWLCDMNNNEILKCILQLNIKPSMYLIFINVAIKIKKNNGRPVDELEAWKKANPNVQRRELRKVYYESNIDRIREYNRVYNLFRNSRINIFRKNRTIL